MASFSTRNLARKGPFSFPFSSLNTVTIGAIINMVVPLQGEQGEQGAIPALMSHIWLIHVFKLSICLFQHWTAPGTLRQPYVDAVLFIKSRLTKTLLRKVCKSLTRMVVTGHQNRAETDSKRFQKACKNLLVLDETITCGGIQYPARRTVKVPGHNHLRQMNQIHPLVKKLRKRVQREGREISYMDSVDQRAKYLSSILWKLVHGPQGWSANQYYSPKRRQFECAKICLFSRIDVVAVAFFCKDMHSRASLDETMFWGWIHLAHDNTVAHIRWLKSAFYTFLRCVASQKLDTALKLRVLRFITS